MRWWFDLCCRAWRQVPSLYIAVSKRGELANAGFVVRLTMPGSNVLVKIAIHRKSVLKGARVAFRRTVA